MSHLPPVLQVRQEGPPLVLAVLPEELHESELVDELESELQDRLSAYGASGWVLDFSQTRFLVSRVLSVLIEHHKKVAASGGRLVLCGLNTNLRRVFKVTRLDEVFPIADTLGAAQQLAAGPPPA